MTTLDPTDGYMILINTFTIEPAKAEVVLKVLEEATDTMRQMPGFVSANLHLSCDRKRIVNYAQWRSEADFKMMLQNRDAQPHMKAAADLAESYEPVLYMLKFSGSNCP